MTSTAVPSASPASTGPSRKGVTILLVCIAVALIVILAVAWVETPGSASHAGSAGPPTGLTATEATTSSVTLSWTNPTPSSTSGVVMYDEVSYTDGHSPATCGIWGAMMPVGTGSTTTVTGLNEDTTYCFLVAAVYANGSTESSVWLTDVETLGPEGQATNSADGSTMVATQPFSVTDGQLMLATVTSYGARAPPTLTTQDSETFVLVTSSTNVADPELTTYVFSAVADQTTSSEVVTLTDTVASEYMLGIVSYSSTTTVATVGTWATSTSTLDSANVSAQGGDTLVACIGYVTDVGGATFNPTYTDATWTAATINSRADQWYLTGGAVLGTNYGTVIRGLAGATSIVLIALS